MATRLTRSGALHHKENADAQAGKRQRTAARQPLSAAAQNAPPAEPPIEFAEREDVDTLLNEKMKGKNKMDYKGKSEQMMEYIKKLRACIKWLLEREDANLAEIGKLNGLLEAAEKDHSEIVAQLKGAIEESKAINEELQKQYASLEENLKKVEAEKMDALQSYGDEKEARIAVRLAEKRLNEQLHVDQDASGHK